MISVSDMFNIQVADDILLELIFETVQIVSQPIPKVANIVLITTSHFTKKLKGGIYS